LRSAGPVSVAALLAGAVFLAGVGSAAAQAGTDRERRAVEILDVDHLKFSLRDRLILDVRPLEAYIKAHIMLSHPLDLQALEKAVLAGPEPDRAALLETFGRTPVRGGRPTVVYGASHLGRRDGYAAWLLAYGGLPQVEILDGGFVAWGRRRNLGVHQGHPIPGGIPSLRETELTPRPELRVDPEAIVEGPPPGAAILEVLPPEHGGDPPGSGQVRVDELLDPDLMFLYPFHLRELLANRAVDPDARLLLTGERDVAGLAWAALTANGFDAALVMAASGGPPPGSAP
jgi:3-mercaptopyruvate sulfurtransferase SseA